MIAHISGKLLELAADSVIVDNNGVGYEIFCSRQTLDELNSKLLSAVSLHIHTHMREDNLQLFGFVTRAEKQLFLALIKVNGIGPKVAIHALSGAPISTIYQMIENEDVKSLTGLPKIGKKTAEQIILSLKGKLVLEEKTSGSRPQPRELTSALLNLGFRSQDIDRVIQKMPEDLDLEQSLRQALAQLTTL